MICLIINYNFIICYLKNLYNIIFNKFFSCYFNAIPSPSDGLHSQDLDSSVYYSYWVEIPSHGHIGHKALRALKRHASIMAKYHAGSPHVVKFLKRVHNWLSKVESPLSGEEWLSNITSLQVRASIPLLLLINLI